MIYLQSICMIHFWQDCARCRTKQRLRPPNGGSLRLHMVNGGRAKKITVKMNNLKLKDSDSVSSHINDNPWVVLLDVQVNQTSHDQILPWLVVETVKRVLKSTDFCQKWWLSQNAWHRKPSTFSWLCAFRELLELWNMQLGLRRPGRKHQNYNSF